jgi:L-methionine (R)-S-oxide reductase
MNSLYSRLLNKIESFVTTGASVHDILLNTCNLLKNNVYHYDWVGFYILDDQQACLLLGPYCGKSTEHTLIPVGKGVCGQVAGTKKLKIVQDVSKEGNYIACSLEVQSEIVVPILKGDQFIAEIDIDSHSPAPFTSEDEDFLTLVCDKLSIIF